MTAAAIRAAPIAQVSDVNASTMTSTMPGVVASITPRRPPSILATSMPCQSSWAHCGIAPSVDQSRSDLGRSEVGTLGRHSRHLSAMPGQLAGEGDCVVDRGGAGVVVEVDVHVLAVRVGLDEPVHPPGELVVRVERPR